MQPSSQHMETLIGRFTETLEDGVMTRQERTDLRKLVAGQNLDSAALNILRSRIFAFASQRMDGSNSVKILAWLEEVVKILFERLSAQIIPTPSSVRFSPGNSCRDAIIALLRQSRLQADICVFTIADDLISREILRAQERRVALRIITDDAKQWDLGSDIERLARAGIEVRTDASSAHMHHKFAIFDHKTLVTGSFNWTLSASQYNQENILESTEPTMVKAYAGEFERLWTLFADDA